MNNYKDTVVTTRVRLARNITDIPFPKKLPPRDERMYSVLMKGVQEAAFRTGEFDFYMIGNMTDVDKMVLFEKRLISTDLLNCTDNGAVLINKAENVAVMINEEDHIRAQCFADGLELEGAYRIINELDDEFAKELNIAFDERLGYLTSCPTNLGTGMRASVMMFLPALTLTNTISPILNSAQKAGITTRGVYGEGSNAEGYMYQISNQTTLGQSEHEVLQRVRNTVLKISEAELISRDKLYKADPTAMKDRVCRAFGLLTSACILTHTEFMSQISGIKLGIYYKLLDIPYDVVNGLITATEPANLSKLTKKQLDQRGADVARAVLTKERLKKYKIKD